jgi:hypothetical protein
MSCCAPKKSDEKATSNGGGCCGPSTTPSNDGATNDVNDGDDVNHADVSEYYGQTLEKTEDLKTNACCTAGAPPKYIRDALRKVHPDVIAKYYGCGLCIPELLDGCTVLDLG